MAKGRTSRRSYTDNGAFYVSVALSQYKRAQHDWRNAQTVATDLGWSEKEEQWSRTIQMRTACYKWKRALMNESLGRKWDDLKFGDWLYAWLFTDANDNL